MRFWIFILLLFLTAGIVRAEEKIDGFVVTPQSAEFALYDNVLSPDSLNITLACVGTKVHFEEKRAGKVFTYECDFICGDTGFEWQIISGKPWVKFSPARGRGTTLTEVAVSVDTDYLKNVLPESCGEKACFQSDVIFRINYHLSHCVVSYEECDEEGKNCKIYTNPASVTYYKEHKFEDFVTVYYTLGGLKPRLSPKELLFQGVISNKVPSFDWQTTKILAGHQGWDYETSASWLVFEKISQNESDPIESSLHIQPRGLTSQGLYKAYVIIRDRATGEESKLLVTTDIKGDNPAWAHLVYAISPRIKVFDREELFTPQWLDIEFVLGPEGQDEPLYVEVWHSAFPDYVFAYRWQDGKPRFDVALYKEAPVKNIDELYYAPYGASSVKIGRFRLAHLPGEAFIRLKKGPAWDLSKTLAEIDLSIKSIAGTWRVTDTVEGKSFVHPYLLSITEDLGTLHASWGNYGPLIRYSSDPTYLYEIIFHHEDFTFRYLINHVEAGYFSGVWSYTRDGYQYSLPQPFYGVKTDLLEGETP